MVVNEVNEPLATMQLTRIPGMARRGSTRLLIEAVRVRSDYRSSGIGTGMMRWVTGTAAPSVEASLVQLTSDEARQDAHRFYERLGFIGSHRGSSTKLGEAHHHRLRAIHKRIRHWEYPSTMNGVDAALRNRGTYPLLTSAEEEP